MESSRTAYLAWFVPTSPHEFNLLVKPIIQSLIVLKSVICFRLDERYLSSFQVLLNRSQDGQIHALCVDNQLVNFPDL